MSKSKQRKQRRQQAITPLPSKRPSRRPRALIFSVLLCLLIGSVGWAGWRSFSSLPVPAPSTSTSSVSPATPTKEYIYAGGRLVATEEPVGSSLTAPGSLTALWAAPGSATGITLNWQASTGGTVSHCVIERQPASSQTLTTTATSFSDTDITPGQAYLYHVRAVDTQNQYSPYSNPDIATVITFQDDPLCSLEVPCPSQPATRVQAIHFTQLRAAIKAVRDLVVGLETAWTEAITTGVEVKADHIDEMRARLTEARTALGLPALANSTPTAGASVGIRAAHITELRDGVK